MTSSRPLGSSAARLMRSPEESFSMVLPISRSVLPRLRQALSAVMLLLMLRDMGFLLEGVFVGVLARVILDR